MEKLIIFLKVMLLSLLGSCLMYLLFIIRGSAKIELAGFLYFLLEFTPMLCCVIFLSMYQKYIGK